MLHSYENKNVLEYNIVGRLILFVKSIEKSVHRQSHIKRLQKIRWKISENIEEEKKCERKEMFFSIGMISLFKSCRPLSQRQSDIDTSQKCHSSLCFAI